MKKEKIGFCISLFLSILFFASMCIFGVLTVKSYNSLESDDELEKRSQFAYFGYYDKNIELPKEKLLDREYLNNNTIDENYYALFFTLTVCCVPLCGLSLITFGFFCDCLEDIFKN